MDPKILEALAGATAGQNLLFVRLGEEVLLCPIALDAPIDASAIQSVGIDDPEARRTALTLLCSRLVTELMRPDELAAAVKRGVEIAAEKTEG